MVSNRRGVILKIWDYFFYKEPITTDVGSEKLMRNRKLTKVVIAGILVTSLLSISVIIIMVVISDMKAAKAAILNFFAVALACTAVGGIMGFLFSIPRFNKDRDKDKDDDSYQREPYYKDNTNLEEISDWLTKIIVGVSLVEFKKILVYLEKASMVLSQSFGSTTNGEYLAFGYGCIIFYLLAGFIVGYIWTRIVFTEMLFINNSLYGNSENPEMQKLATSALTRNIISSTKDVYLSSEFDTEEFKKNNEALVKFRDERVAEFLRARPVIVPDDLQKNRWGGKPENNDIKLSAEVNASETHKGLFDIKIKVERLDKKPMNRNIAILVHNSFNIPNSTIFIKKGETSEVSLVGYKAFTIGAIIDDKTAENDNTILELDLSDRSLSEYAKEFYR